MTAGLADNAEVRERFLREARAAYQECAEMAGALAQLRKTFEVEMQLAALERQRKALLAQLDRQPSVMPPATRPQAAASAVAPSQATRLQQALSR
jgi:hypothetical protein